MPDTEEKKRTSYVCQLTNEQATVLGDLLQQRDWEVDQIPYSHWRARKEKTTATAYKSGKFVAQGRGVQELVEFILEPMVTQEARFGYELLHAVDEDPRMFQPHAGIDESGKGDYFGPLVIAAAYVDERSSQELFDLGVTDSKNIKSDKKISFLAQRTRSVVQGKYAIVAIGPEAYNRMYSKIRNVNKLLGWGHARALENLLQKQTDCPRAISDQFGKKSTVQNALMTAGRKVLLEQRPKAEADIAVAAASILARDEFVKRLQSLGEKAGVELPKGASKAVITCAVTLAQKVGMDELAQYAKMHFKTTDQVKSQAGL